MELLFELEREPIHPGEILKCEFMDEMGITQMQLAKDLGVDYKTVNEVVNERRNISPKMALLLAKYFNISVHFWLNLQNKYDIYKVIQNRKNKQDIDKVKMVK